MKLNRTLALVLMAWSSLTIASTPIDQTRPLRADGRLHIENVKGSVEVRTWDRTEVHIGGTLGEGVKELDINGSDANLRVKVDYPQGGWFGKGNSEPSDLVVTLPVGAELEIDVVSADVDVAGVAGRRLAIESVSGRISAQGSPAQAELESVSGDMEATLDSPDLKATTVSGGLRITNASGGQIALETVSGDIDLNAGTIKQLSLDSVSGSADADLQGLTNDGRIKGETLSGRLRVSLPGNTSASLSISTFSGSIRSTAGEVKHERYGPGASLETRLGDGDGKIDLESFSGSVRFDLR